MKDLEQEGFITSFGQDEVKPLSKLSNVRKIRFYANSDAVQTRDGLQKMTKRIERTARLLDKYSNPENTRVLGKQLESLVENQLRAYQFDILGKHTNEYGGRKWTETHENLDLVAKRNNLVIGEVKNTLGVMRPQEIDAKIDMCGHLGIVPVFAVRWIKPYIQCIRQRGGFSWVFKTQILPFGQEGLKQRMFDRLSVLNKRSGSGRRLEFPITVRNDLPPKAAKFELWATRAESCKPDVKAEPRCSKS